MVVGVSGVSGVCWNSGICAFCGEQYDNDGCGRSASILAGVVIRSSVEVSGCDGVRISGLARRLLFGEDAARRSGSPGVPHCDGETEARGNSGTRAEFVKHRGTEIGVRGWDRRTFTGDC